MPTEQTAPRPTSLARPQSAVEPQDDSDPLVSVIIPCYNAAATLPALLSALVEQVDPPPFEVIVSDNLSTDGFRSVVDAFRDTLPRISVVAAHTSRGRAVARNIPVRHARGQHLVFIDADDIPSPHLLRRLHDALEVHDLAIAPSDASAFHGDDAPDAGRLRAVEEDAARHEEQAPPHAGRFVITGGSGLAVRRDAFFEIGDFQTRYRSQEDIEFGARAQLLGFTVQRVSGCLIHYRSRTSFRAFLRQQRQFGRGDVHMWSDYEHHAGVPLSFSADVRRLARGIASLPTIPARDVKGHLGAILKAGSKVEGHLRYRWRSVLGITARHRHRSEY
ncbi:glycosyltransferase [Brachybacterium sp. AOP25-B2-12]|uniref:glycosyltransferase n=1 Tax=Brachybacterium sp. AOP25-B2-12 TaxID=3457710 RepID=UPI004033870D